MPNAWGVSALTYTAGSATTSSGTVLTANASRKYLRIENTSATAPVWLRFGTAAAVANVGYGLAAFGSAPCVLELTTGAGNVWTGVVTAIAPTVDTGTATLAIVQGT